MNKQLISQRKGHGKVFRVTDMFGNFKYILLDKYDNLAAENCNGNILLKKLWDKGR